MPEQLVKTPDLQDELNYIAERLKDVDKYKLQAEVITFALQAMKFNPSLSLIEAFESGCEEWDV